MIIAEELDEKIDRDLVRNLCCPICLSTLICSDVDERIQHLICDSCESTFPVIGGLPCFLLKDENWEIKTDEIQGEVDYNLKKIPMEVHNQRNEFIDTNTLKFLEESHIDLTNDIVLSVGGSFSELLLLFPRCTSITCIDIVPSIVKLFLDETRRRKIPASWVCGDGECLPFENETFDTVIIRQTLHHLLKYHSAISEFFRVCKTGGRVLIIDEPFVAPHFNAPPISLLPSNYELYQGVKLGGIRRKLKIPEPTVIYNRNEDIIALLDGKRVHVDSDRHDSETMLSEKYLSLSILSCIYALKLHSSDFGLFWPEEVAWVDSSADIPRFCHGPNPVLKASLVKRPISERCLSILAGKWPSAYEDPLIKKLTSDGWLSILARKRSVTTVFRDRSSLRAIPIDSPVYTAPALKIAK